MEKSRTQRFHEIQGNNKEMTTSSWRMLSRQRDGGWSWVVLGAVILTQTILGGICLTGGVLYVIFRNALGSSPVTLTWLCALPTTMWFLGTPVGSFFTNYFSNRTCALIGGIMTSCGLSLGFFAEDVGLLFFTYGLLTGLGCGINYTACMSAINQYFHKYKTLATGLASVGNNIGLIMFTKLIIELDRWYGWKGTMLLWGALSAHMCVFAMCLSPVEDWKTDHGYEIECVYNPETETSTPFLSAPGSKNTVALVTEYPEYNGSLMADKQAGVEGNKPIEINSCLSTVKKSTLKTRKPKRSISWSLYCHRTFALFCLSNFLTNLNFGIWGLLTPSFTKIHGFTNDDIATFFLVFGLANIFGKFVYSFLGQVPFVNNTLVYSLSIAVTGVATALIPVLTSRAGILTLAAANGFFSCVTGALIQVVIYNIVGYELFPDGVGLSCPFKAFGSLLGGPLGGLLLVLTGTYDLSFYLAGVSIILAAICLVPAIMKERHRKRHTDDEH